MGKATRDPRDPEVVVTHVLEKPSKSSDGRYGMASLRRARLRLSVVGEALRRCGSDQPVPGLSAGQLMLIRARMQYWGPGGRTIADELHETWIDLTSGISALERSGIEVSFSPAPPVSSTLRETVEGDAAVRAQLDGEVPR